MQDVAGEVHLLDKVYPSIEIPSEELRGRVDGLALHGFRESKDDDD